MRASLIQIDVLPADEADSVILAQIEASAFAVDNPLAILTGPPSATSQESRAKDLATSMKSDPSVKYTKAVIDGQVVAWARWHYYMEPGSALVWEDTEWDASPNPQACHEFFGAIARKRNEHMDGKRYACRSSVSQSL
jgi:hypothetical protein